MEYFMELLNALTVNLAQVELTEVKYSQLCLSRTSPTSNNRLSQRSIQASSLYILLFLTPHKSNFL